MDLFRPPAPSNEYQSSYPKFCVAYLDSETSNFIRTDAFPVSSDEPAYFREYILQKSERAGSAWVDNQFFVVWFDLSNTLKTLNCGSQPSINIGETLGRLSEAQEFFCQFSLPIESNGPTKWSNYRSTVHGIPHDDLNKAVVRIGDRESVTRFRMESTGAVHFRTNVSRTILSFISRSLVFRKV